MKKRNLFIILLLIITAMLFASCNGENGNDGADGVDGAPGVGITDVKISEDGELVLTMSDKGVKNLGSIIGADGVGVASANINASGELVMTMTDGIVKNLGKVTGGSGSGTAVGISEAVVNSSGDLILTMTDSTIKNLGRVVGADGADGVKGDTGAKGETGIAGAKGDKGDTGLGIQTVVVNTAGELVLTMTDNSVKNLGKIIGENGADGINGINGTDGTKGDKGDKGDTGKGIQSVTIDEDGFLIVTFTDNSRAYLGGVTGDKGDKGDKGDTGSKGDTGKSAFELYRDTYGYTGTESEWINELISGSLTKYTVTFDLNGGTAGADYAATARVSAGNSMPLSTPEREGYHFLGWFTGEGANSAKFTEVDCVTRNLTLTAGWQAKKMTVTFLDRNGNTLDVQHVDYGTGATAPALPDVDNVRFESWDTEFSDVRADITVRAIYTSIYKVSFVTNGGNEIPDSVFYIGENVRLPEAPTKADCYFVAWYFNPELTDKFASNKYSNQNVTLYAKYADMLAITTAAELNDIRNRTSAKYYLANDINLDGAEWLPIDNFTGTLDGREHRIYNFCITDEAPNIGLFTQLGGTVKNLKMEDFFINQTYTAVANGSAFNVGCIAAVNNGTIENCTVKPELTFNIDKEISGFSYSLNLGAVTGNNNGTVGSCTIDGVINIDVRTAISAATVNSYLYYGAIAGENTGKVSACLSKGNMTITNRVYVCAHRGNGAIVNCNNYIGGMVGYNQGTVADVLECSSEININYNGNVYLESLYNGYYASSKGLYLTGGLVGYNGKDANVEKSKAIGNVTGNIKTTFGSFISWEDQCNFGGACGRNDGKIQECVANVSVDFPVKATNLNKNIAGGFVGSNTTTGKITNCYSGGNVCAMDWCGGFVGQNEGSIVTSYSTGNAKATEKGVGGFVGNNVASGTISKCFSTGDVTSNSTDNYNHFAGINDGTANKCHYLTESKLFVGESEAIKDEPNATVKTAAELQSSAFLVDTLYWNADVWSFEPDKYPVLVCEKQ